MTSADLAIRLAQVFDLRTDIRFAVLFGSAATGATDQARDVDIAISPKRPLSWIELAELAVALEEVAGKEVDLVEIDDASTLLRWEVLQTGRPIAIADADAWRAFQTRLAFEYDDLRPHLDRQSEGLRRVLEKSRWSAST